MGYRMEDNKETTTWTGVGVAVGWMSANHLWEQVLNAIIISVVGWFSLYLFKNLVTYLESLAKNWWKNRKTKDNNQ
jgi:hypothetical protein